MLVGKVDGVIELLVELFDVLVNIVLMYQVVIVQWVVVCQGIYLMKMCGEVSGGGCKFYWQKGIGYVWQGLMWVLQFIGGGVVYGFKLCDYSQCIFKKMIVVVLCGVLFDWVCNGCIYVIIELVEG